jgi:chromosome segregation ATPase
LLRENGSMDEVKEKSKNNQRLADDRLEERQKMEAELRQAKAEGKESEERAKKADGKAEEIKKNWHIAKNELLDVHRRNRKLKVELKKHANCPGGNIVKRE